MMERYLFCSVGALLLASVGGFFLYVPIVTLFAGVVIILGLILMFSLGVYLGSKRTVRIKPACSPRESSRLELVRTCRQAGN
jgi:hypothetical protein